MFFPGTRERLLSIIPFDGSGKTWCWIQVIIRTKMKMLLSGTDMWVLL